MIDTVLVGLIFLACLLYGIGSFRLAFWVADKLFGEGYSWGNFTAYMTTLFVMAWIPVVIIASVLGG